ncbi:hypothetical protein BDW62DRAFT_46982 [Aspergillus aurantiobrunneus]
MAPSRPSSFQSWLLKGIGRAVQRQEKDATENGDLPLDRLCEPPEQWWEDNPPRINAWKFNAIAKLLETSDKAQDRHLSHSWSKRPRLYTVLRNIGCLNLLDQFASYKFTDYNLPFNEVTLPGFVHDEEVRQAFLLHQRYVLTDTHHLEDGGPHMFLDESADVYFHHVHDLGQGGYGAVDHVMSKLSLRSYARKRVLRGPDSDTNRRAQGYLIEELTALKSLSHEHLVQYIGSYTDKQHIAFLMSPVADMDLDKYLRRLAENAKNKLTSLRYFFGCLAGAVEYLHRQQIGHRDIKLSNILVRNDRVFISDFGTVHFRNGTRRTTTHGRTVPQTLYYIAPEVAEGQPATMASDMWSLGLVFLEIATVLLGSTLQGFSHQLNLSARAKRREPYLWNHGDEPYAWNNVDAVYAWMDKLRRSHSAAESDNETLMWTRALLQRKPDRRLNADRLMQQIQVSPSFSAFCCLDCRPQYADREHRQSKSHVTEHQTSTSSQDVKEQVAALFEGNTIAEPDSKEAEKQRTIESWITSIHEESESYAEYDPDQGSKWFPSLTEESVLPFSIVQDGPSAAEDYEAQSFHHREHPLTTGEEVLPSLPPIRTTESEPTDSSTRLRSTATGLTDATTQLSSFPGEALADQSNPWAERDQPSNTAWLDNTLESQVTVNVWATDDSASYLENKATDLPERAFQMNVWDDDTYIPEATLAPVTNTFSANGGAREEIVADGIVEKAEYEAASPTVTPPSDVAIQVGRSDDVEAIQATPDSVLCHATDSTNPPGLPVDISVNSEGLEVEYKHLEENPPSKAQSSARSSDNGDNGKVLSLPSTSPVVGSKGSPSNDINQTQCIDSIPYQAIEHTDVRIDAAGSESQEIPAQNPVSKPSRAVHFPDNIPGIKTIPAGSEVSNSDGEAKSQNNLHRESQPKSGKSQPAIINSWITSNSVASRPSKKGVKKATSKLGGRPQKPTLNLLKTAVENAARQIEKTTETSNPSGQQFGIFSPEVYMENKWESATTQATQDNRRDIAALSLTRWLERDNHLLEGACRAGKAQVVRHLLSKGCNPGTPKKPRPLPLLHAVRGGTAQHYKCVQALLMKGVDLNVKQCGTGKTALHLAIETADFKGHTNLVRDLAAGGANPNIPDARGELPIHAIFKGGQPGTLEKFRLDALACILKADIHGETEVNVPDPADLNSPLHLAVGKASPFAVGMLLYKGANINAVNSIGLTPLLLAATQWTGPLSSDEEVMLEILLRAPGIELDRTSGSLQRTALHWAVLRCSPSAVRLLMEKGADASMKDSDGKNPIEICHSADSKKWRDERHDIYSLLCPDEQQKSKKEINETYLFDEVMEHLEASVS